MEIDPNPQLYQPPAAVMSFLNEAVQRYPHAISFAPGRPLEEHFGVEEAIEELRRAVVTDAEREGCTAGEVFDRLGQYGETAGRIRRAIADHLERDEGIRVPPEAVLMTTGCQEAMAIVLAGLADRSRDTLLVPDPTYVGITGLAGIFDLPVEPVPSSDEGLDPRELERAIERVRRSGRRPRALYVIPDFDNPLGVSLGLEARTQLLEIAARHGVLVLEDNPYRTFAYDGAPEPTLKALDRWGVVIYLGSFSKTLFPGLRLGYLVADQPVRRPDGVPGGPLAAELARVKSYTTVNTPPLLEAMAAAILERHQGSLAPVVAAKLPAYRLRRDRMTSALERCFGGLDGLRDVRWNRPRGGFFLTLSLPFAFDEEAFADCAERFGVICCPMSFFSRRPDRLHQARLSFSYVPPEQIDEGIERLERFVRDRVGRRVRDHDAPPQATAASRS